MKKRSVLLILCVFTAVLLMSAPASAAGLDQSSVSDALYTLVVEHGAAAMAWALAALATAAAWLIVRLGLSMTWRSVLNELGAHARDVVLEVWQTYVEALKAARVDGKLTEEEKATAKAMAMEKLRARLSWPKLVALGGGLLARAFRRHDWAKKVEELLGSAIETGVADAKRQGKAAGLKTSGKDVPANSSKVSTEAIAVPR